MKSLLKIEVHPGDRRPFLSEHSSASDALMTMTRNLKELMAKGVDIKNVRCTILLKNSNRTLAGEFSHGLYYPKGIGIGYPLLLENVA